MKDNKMTSQEQAEKTREATSRMWEARRARWEAWKKENGTEGGKKCPNSH